MKGREGGEGEMREGEWKGERGVKGGGKWEGGEERGEREGVKREGRGVKEGEGGRGIEGILNTLVSPAQVCH